MSADQKGAFVIIALNENQLALDHGRAAAAPIHLHGEAAKILRPQELAFEVVAKDADHAEISNQPLAIGGGCFGGVGVVDVNRHSRLAGMRRLFPEHFAGGFVEAEHLPAIVDRRRLSVTAEKCRQNSRALAGGPVVGIGPLLILRHRRCHEDFVAPHNRLRPADARDFCFPGEMLVDRPFFRMFRLRGDAVAAGAAELWPVFERRRIDEERPQAARQTTVSDALWKL